MHIMKAVDSRVCCPCVEAYRSCMHKLQIRKLDRDDGWLGELGGPDCENDSVSMMDLKASRNLGHSGPTGKPETGSDMGNNPF